MKSKVLVLVGVMAIVFAGSASAALIGIVNGDFELDGVDDAAPPTGWTDNSSSASFWTGLPDETGNPMQSEWDIAPAPGLGSYILTTARQSAGVGDQPIDGQLVQTVDLTSFDFSGGDQILNVDFVYASDDSRDTGTFSLLLLDASSTELASYSVALDAGSGYDFSGWQEMTVGGLVPVGTSSVVLQIDTTRTGGSETNIWIDNIAGSVVPEPATLALLGLGALVLRRKK